jgi:hypothetical protein
MPDGSQEEGDGGDMAMKFSVPEKWNDPWFRKLKPEEKLMFLYLCDICDCAGFCEVDLYRFSFETRLPEAKIEGVLKGLASPTEGASKVLVWGRWIWLRNHIRHQRNLPLNPLNNCHKGIVSKLLEKTEFPEIKQFIDEFVSSPTEGASEGLTSPIGKGNSNSKGKGKGKERECEGEVDSRWVDLHRTFQQAHDECARVSLENFAVRIHGAGMDSLTDEEILETIETFTCDVASLISFKPQTPLSKFINYLTHTKNSADSEKKLGADVGEMVVKRRPKID